MAAWDDRQYLMFAEERTRAAADLLARVPLARAAHVVDLGSGPGNSTALLAARFPEATVVGVDSSPEMLARARADLPSVRFVEADVRTYRATPAPDVLFANALLQWVPEHAQLLPSLLAQLAPGGALAVQMPCNMDEPSHRLMRELPLPFAEKLAHVRDRARVLAPSDYYDVLAPHAARVDLWQTRYEHVLTDAPAIVEWLKGTGLRPYLDALAPDERAPYLAAYTEAIDRAYPPRAGGKRLFSFPRLFFVAQRADVR